MPMESLSSQLLAAVRGMKNPQSSPGMITPSPHFLPWCLYAGRAARRGRWEYSLGEARLQGASERGTNSLDSSKTT